jgi:hypothetical protein
MEWNIGELSSPIPAAQLTSVPHIGLGKRRRDGDGVAVMIYAQKRVRGTSRQIGS